MYSYTIWKIPLPHTIESRGREEIYERLEFDGFGASYVPYDAAFTPEEVTSKLMEKQDQWPNHSHAELQSVVDVHPIAKSPSSNSVNAMIVDDASHCESKK